ncbi:hypothetical protein Tco_0277044 [Tanacetum coccineum]
MKSEASGKDNQLIRKDSSIQGRFTTSYNKGTCIRGGTREDISPNTLEAAKTSQKVCLFKVRSIDTGRRTKKGEAPSSVKKLQSKTKEQILQRKKLAL